MLSLSPIVQVNVNISTPVIAGTAFSTGLILAPTSATLTEDQQLQLFTSAADMRTAGFQATDPAYLAAVAYFAAYGFFARIREKREARGGKPKA